MEKEVRSIISRLKKGEMDVGDIPEEYENNSDVIAAERKLKLRRIYRCGFDVITNRFFVEEDVLLWTDHSKWSHTDPLYFDDFDSYFKYLDGNIYENACYFQLDPKLLPEGIDLNKLFERKAFIDYTIDDFTMFPSKEEQEKYSEAENRKVKIMKWIEKFNKCTSFQDLKKTVENYGKSALCGEIDVSFYFWNYIFKDIDDKDRFQTIMEYMSTGIYPSYKIINSLCCIYNPDDVVENYKYTGGAYTTCMKHIRSVKKIATSVKNNQYEYKVRKYYDDATHYYCVETNAYLNEQRFPSFSWKRYFDSFYNFVDYLDGSLISCDLSHVRNLDCDFSQYFIDESTKLPLNVIEKYDYSLQKYYRNGTFSVCQIWKRENGSIVKKYEHKFTYFCDFLEFLKGDLSNADLISCEGLKNVLPSDSMILKNALITSDICEKWGIDYNLFEIPVLAETSFNLSEQNESEAELVLQDRRDLMGDACAMKYISAFESYDSSLEKIYYVSDIHMYHLIKNKNPKSKADIIKIVRKVVSTFIEESETKDIILINGDTSLNFSIFQLFVSELARYPRRVIFTIGNHDIWSCPNDTIDQLSEKYRELLTHMECFCFTMMFCFMKILIRLQNESVSRK